MNPSAFRSALSGPILVVVIGTLVTTACGCSRSGLPVHFVEGTVRLDGEPVSGATVSFHPLAAEGMPAYGGTDANGVYQLTTTRGGGRGRGALVGEYVVTISKRRNRLEDLPPQPDADDTAALTQWNRKKEALERLPPDYIVPKEYGDATTAGFTVTVKPGRNTGPDFSFDLAREPTGSTAGR